MWSYYLRVRKVGVRGLKKSGHSVEERMKGRRMKERWQIVLLLSKRSRKQWWGSNRNRERIILGMRNPLEWRWWFTHSRVWLFATPCTTAHQVSLPSTISQSLLKFMCIESVMVSYHLILCGPLLPSIFPSIRVFSNQSISLCIMWLGDSALALVFPVYV